MTTDRVSEGEARGNRVVAANEANRYELDVEQLDAILVDLDGVVTETADVHAAAWKAAFDAYLQERLTQLDGVYRPFDLDDDYKRYVDGKPRYEGVASFLQSRDIYLPPGEESDPPDKETVCGLGNRKNEIFLETIRRRGVQVYPTSVRFIRQARSRGIKVAVVTSSRNCREVLEAAKIADLFDAQVDGIVAREWMLDGKPAPDTFLEAAHRLGVDPRRACVIEDSASGVQAGKAGDFGLVIGVSRDGRPRLLEQCGADIVVSDLGELAIGDDDPASAMPVPLALDRLAEIKARIRNRPVAIFLDYDGTLSPIVDRPEDAVISDEMRAAIRELAGRCAVVVISGRALEDVTRRVGLETVIYAGSHGFDIAGPSGRGIQHKEGADYVPAIARAARDLRRRLGSIEGVIVEDKTYAVAVHYRMVKAGRLGRVKQAVDSVLARYPSLRRTRGKKVFELRPGMDWDKGKAVLWLLHALDLESRRVVPFYLGDDVTDRDAFRALRGKGISILVAEEEQATTADYRLADPSEVQTFLQKLAAILGERDA